MRYKLLGKSGLRVSEMCLGTMTFGDDWGWGASKEVSRQMFDAFVEAGGNFIDTANLYTGGTSERFVGEFIASDRDRFVVATKYTNALPGTDPNAGGNHRKSMMRAVEASLKRMQTDYIDLYWVHIWDPMTPTEEVMRGLDDLVRAGKVLYIGISDAPAWVVAHANTLAELRGWSSYVGIQVEYNLIERTAERELLPMARTFDIGVTAWSPLASGLLTGKYNRTATPEQASEEKRLEAAPFKQVTERSLAIADAVQKLATEIGCSPAQVALAWVRQKQTIPILGARKITQFEDNLASLALHLTDAQMQQLDEVSAIEMGFPHDFMSLEAVRGFAYGGMYEQIDNHRR